MPVNLKEIDKKHQRSKERTIDAVAKATRMSQEAEAEAAAARAPSNQMLELFKAPTTASIMDTMKRRNLPQMIKAVDGDRENIPVGGIVSGILVDVVKSPVSTIKGNLLWLHLVTFDEKGKPVKSGTEITFPATGVIRNALAPGIEGEENARKEMEKLKGHLFIMQRGPSKLNSKYKKDMTMWDVRTSDKPVDIGVKIN